MTDADYIDYLVLLANTLAQAESQLHNLVQVARGIGLDIKQIYIFNKTHLSSLSGEPLKLEDQFTYFGSNISSTESDISIHTGKAWTASDWL